MREREKRVRVRAHRREGALQKRDDNSKVHGKRFKFTSGTQKNAKQNILSQYTR